MDNQNLNTDKYLEKLSPKVQDFISNSEWQTRTEEIAKKYNLNPEQTESLVNDVMLFLIGVGNDEDFAKVIKEDVGASDILTEQIIEDIGKRVFEYALKMIETQKSPETTPAKPIIPKMIYPEVRPDNLPTQTTTPAKEEKISVPKYAPIGVTDKPASSLEQKSKVEFKPLQNSVKSEENKDLPQQAVNPKILDPIPSQFGKITYAPESKIGNNGEQKVELVQKPANIPRFDLNKDTPTSEEIPNENNKVSSIIDSKLKNITSSAQDTVEEKITETKPAETPITKQYSVDPYREPLQ